MGGGFLTEYDVKEDVYDIPGGGGDDNYYYYGDDYGGGEGGDYASYEGDDYPSDGDKQTDTKLPEDLKGKGCIDSTSVQDTSTLVAVVDSSRCTEVVSHLAGNTQMATCTARTLKLYHPRTFPYLILNSCVGIQPL